jgi:uncharacterized protein (DUF2147 family)
MRAFCVRAAVLCILAIGLPAVGVNLIVPARAADPLGKWYTADHDSQVRIVNCHGALCGSVVWLQHPVDPATGRPKTDKNNPDPKRRSRPLIGVEIVLGMRPSGTPNQWSGNVYNSQDGRTYSGSFTLEGPNTAELKGCVLGGLFCKSQVWTRAK